MQPGSDADLSTLLNKKRPPITVDGNGGLFSRPASRSEAHTLISGGNQRRGGLSSDHEGKWALFGMQVSVSGPTTLKLTRISRTDPGR